VPRERHSGARDAPFGRINRPKNQLNKSVRDFLAEVRHQRCLADKSATRVYPLKKLRESFIKITHLDVITQPVGCKVSSYTDKNGLKPKPGCKTVDNPIWDRAPPGAYFKAKRLGGLVTKIATIGGNSKLARLIKRLAINVWHMSRRDFLGLCRSISAQIAHSLEREKLFRKSPEDLMRMGPLISKPRLKTCRKENPSPYIRGCSECAYLRLSTKVEVRRIALKCTKCTGPTCVGKWLTPSQSNSTVRA